MKKITLLVTAVFLMGSLSNASAGTYPNEANHPVSIADAEPIVFVERGIEFFVFADGQFDFNTVPSNAGQYYRTGRNTMNSTYGAPGSNGGVRIEHDVNGRVRRVGNVFINYDANYRIKRIGSVYMSYNNYALSQVGGLTIQYNRRGEIIGTLGFVNGNSGYTTPQNGNGTSYGNGGYEENNDDQYYYRSPRKNSRTK